MLLNFLSRLFLTLVIWLKKVSMFQREFGEVSSFPKKVSNQISPYLPKFILGKIAPRTCLRGLHFPHQTIPYHTIRYICICTAIELE